MVDELNGKITADSGIHRIGSAGSRNAVGIAVGALVEDIIDSDADLAETVPEKPLSDIQVTQDKFVIVPTVNTPVLAVVCCCGN